MKISKEIKTGVLALGSIALLIFGYSFLSGSNLFKNSREFYVKYENVEGLAMTAPVTINGLTVGKVENITFADEPGWLVVKFRIDSDIEFSKTSIAQIYSAGLIGGKSLAVFPDYRSGDIAKSGDTLKGISEDGMMAAVTKALGPLERKVNNTLATVDTLLFNVNDIIDNETRNNLREAIKNLNITLNSFSDVSENLNLILSQNTDNLNSTFTNLDRTAGNLAQLTDSLAQLETGKLVANLQDVVTRMDNIMIDIDEGNGTVGKFLKDENLYDNLEGASKELEQLLEDLKLNPKRYVHFSLFGKRQKPYKEPTNSDQ